MKLLSPQQIQAWDAFTIEHEPISSIDLMERASLQCTDKIIEDGFTDKPVKIFCGKGNNGGDGLAIARQLLQQGFKPQIYIIELGAKGTNDFQTNLQRLHQITKEIHFIQSPEFFPVIDKSDIIIDALFGSGLNRPLQDLNAAIVEHINKAAATVISIDVPSGMFIDKSSKGNIIIKANYTFTFQVIKLCLMVSDNADWFGEVTVLKIGLLEKYLEAISPTFEIVSLQQIKNYLKPRKNFSHKGTYGHALLVAGNTGKMGAAELAAKACLRTGVGLLTVNVPKAGLDIIQIAAPEAMAIIRGEEETDLSIFSAIGIGPGLGTTNDVQELLQTVLKNYKKPMLIDADALNIIGLNKDWLRLIPKDSILTPHPKEFERLFGECNSDFERFEKALKASTEYGLTIILKGHYTLIAHEGKGWFNNTGNAGMATGGSGDVLTGIITSLLAQKYASLEAALTGVYLHGLSGDLCLEDQSMESLLPTDLINHLGKAFNYLNFES